MRASTKRDVRDALIAATALVHGLTRNSDDFVPMKVNAVNPFT